MSEHVHEDREVAIGIVFDYCPDAGSAKPKAVMVEPSGVTVEDITTTMIGVLENTLAMAMLNSPGPVRDYATREWPGGKFDATEAQRFAAMVANQVLLRMVMKRDYAMLAAFHAVNGSGPDLS